MQIPIPAQNPKDKILDIIKRRGPSLPVHIANETKLTMLFASAFLADLLSNKEIRISHMRVGSSPIYFIPGQEPQLENYSQHLKSKEKDAYKILQENKFLKDEEQDPAIRVALREIKDFAIQFHKEGKIIWRYFTTPESEYKQEAVKIIPPEKVLEEEISEIVKEIKPEEIIKKIEIFQPKEIEIVSEQKEVNFINKVLKWLQTNEKIKLIEETELKKKDFLGIGRIESSLGEMEILLIAKDKKKITEKDLDKLMEKIQESNRIVLLFSNGEIDKKAVDAYRKLKNIIFIKNL